MLFSSLKEKQQKAYRLESYDDILLQSAMSMLVYRGFPKSVNTKFIEKYRLMDGACAIWKNNNKYIVSRVDFGGMPDENGIGTIAICSTDNGVVKQFDNWKENPDVAIIFNNSLYAPDLSIGMISDLLAETDLSMKFNLIYTRLYPIPIAKDQKIKTAIDLAMGNIKDGKLATVLAEDVLADVTENSTTEIPVINLTNVRDSDKIQHLAKFRDDLFRWFYSLNGMNSQGSSKMAQQTVAEVNQDSNASMIIPHDRYHCAMEGIEMCNEKFGNDPEWVTAEVSFSEPWQNREAQCKEEFSEKVEENENLVLQLDEEDDSINTSNEDEVAEDNKDEE